MDRNKKTIEIETESHLAGFLLFNIIGLVGQLFEADRRFQRIVTVIGNKLIRFVAIL